MSETFAFAVNSSDGVSSYEVVIFIQDCHVVVQCSCPAGKIAKLCRHKIQLLGDEREILADWAQGDLLGSVLRIIENSAVLAEFRRFKEHEASYNDARAIFEKSKRNLERILKGVA